MFLKVCADSGARTDPGGIIPFSSIAAEARSARFILIGQSSRASLPLACEEFSPYGLGETGRHSNSRFPRGTARSSLTTGKNRSMIVYDIIAP
jgi:hypothetical protein